MEGTSSRGSLHESLEKVHGLVPGLEGVTGRLRIEVGANEASSRLFGVLSVNDGDVEFVLGDGEAGTLVRVATYDDIEAFLLGELNPVVATLQGRLAIEGDLELASRIILALQSGSPFHGDLVREEM